MQNLSTLRPGIGNVPRRVTRRDGCLVSRCHVHGVSDHSSTRQIIRDGRSRLALFVTLAVSLMRSLGHTPVYWSGSNV